MMTDSTAGTSAQQMGQQLRQAREASGLDVGTVAARLRMQKNLIRSLEQGDWSRLGAPVFVRGHLRSYARLVGIELDGLDEITANRPVPVTPMVRTGRGRQMFGWLGMRMVYVVVTALIAVPVWMAAQRHLSAPDEVRAIALDIPEVRPALPELLPEATPGQGEPTVPPAMSVPPATEALPRPFTAMASLLPSPAPEPSPSGITLHVHQDSWVELHAANGRRLEQDLLKAGEVRRFARGQLGRVVIGNVDGVEMRINGEIQDLSRWRRANVARFAVSSDDVIGPALD